MVQRKVIVRGATNQALDELDATDIPDLSATYEASGANAAHLADATDAHDASAISFTPNGSIAATDVQAAIQEVRDEAAGGGAPSTSDYLVGTADGGLSNEIVVGTSPGGELGGTWASPTVDATHAGSTHSAATDTHIADTTDVHDASAISFSPAGTIAATDVQAAIEEVASEASGGGGVGNLWTMSKTTSQTLTSNADTVITFDRADIDGGGSVIDLANNRFVAPATGSYLAFPHWMWEATAPNGAGRTSAAVGGTIAAPVVRLNGATQGSTGSIVGPVSLALTAGDFVTMICHPGAAVTPTARGNASRTLSTSFTLVRIT